MVTVTWGLAVRPRSVIGEPVCPRRQLGCHCGLCQTPDPAAVFFLDTAASAEGMMIKSSVVPAFQLQVPACFLGGTVHQPAQSTVLAQS